jgi:hypothetical protein
VSIGSAAANVPQSQRRDNQVKCHRNEPQSQRHSNSLLPNNVLLLFAITPTLQALQPIELELTEWPKGEDAVEHARNHDAAVLTRLAEVTYDVASVFLAGDVEDGECRHGDSIEILVAEGAQVLWVGVGKADAVADDGGDDNSVGSFGWVHAADVHWDGVSDGYLDEGKIGKKRLEPLDERGLEG